MSNRKTLRIQDQAKYLGCQLFYFNRRRTFGERLNTFWDGSMDTIQHFIENVPKIKLTSIARNRNVRDLSNTAVFSANRFSTPNPKLSVK